MNSPSDTHPKPSPFLDFITQDSYRKSDHLPSSELPSNVKTPTFTYPSNPRIKCLMESDSNDDLGLEFRLDEYVEENGLLDEKTCVEMIASYITNPIYESNLRRFEKILSCSVAHSPDTLIIFARKCIIHNRPCFLKYLLESNINLTNPSIILEVLNSNKIETLILAQTYGMDLALHANLGLCFTIDRAIVCGEDSKASFEKLIDFFIGLGADINCQNGLPITLTIFNTSAIPKLIKLGADINARNGYLLRHFVDDFSERNIDFLLDLKPDISCLDSRDLVICVTNCSSVILKKLIDLGADFSSINMADEETFDEDGETKIDLLLKEGLDISLIAKMFAYD